MTATGRTVIVGLVLVLAAALAITSMIVDASGAAAGFAAFTGLTGTVLGYAFGDRNGEKRLAAAIVTRSAGMESPTAQNAAVQMAHDVVTPSTSAHDARTRPD